MGIDSRPRRLDHKYKFTVEIDGFSFAGFNKCSPIRWEVGKVAYAEGGAIYDTKEPGRVSVDDVTLERGVGVDQDMYEWMRQCVNFAANGGAVPDALKRSLEVVQRRRDGSEVKRWALYGAWPCAYEGGEWDNDAEEVVMEKMTLCYDFPEPDESAV